MTTLNPIPDPTPKSLFTELTKAFPDIDQLLQDLQTSEAQLRELATSAQLDTKLQLTLRLASIRLQLLFAKFADTAVTALTKILDSDKPETARRAANTLLQLAGLLGPKKPALKPWQIPATQNDITKQHLPTYNDLCPPNPTPNAHAPSSPQPAPAERPFPVTITPRPANPLSESSPQNSAPKTVITNIQGPTYRHLPQPQSKYHQALAAIFPPAG